MIVTDTYTPARSDAHRLGHQLLGEVMETWVTDMSERLVTDGLARWIFDPEVDRVVALVAVDGNYPTSRQEALIVAYLDDEDAEISQSFDSLAEHY